MVTTALDTSAAASLQTSARALQWTARALTATCWISAALFGLYILAFYAAALVDGNIAQWNEGLPRLYESDTADGDCRNRSALRCGAASFSRSAAFSSLRRFARVIPPRIAGLVVCM
jgi:hypothetical protein